MRRGVRMVAESATWIDGDFYAHVSQYAMTIKAGSRQRGLPCIGCRTPAGGQPIHVVCVVAGLLCPSDASHLGGLGMFCHARCIPKRESDMARLIADAFKAASH